MKNLGFSMALAMITLGVVTEFAPARAQQVVVTPQPYVYSSAPQTYYYYPTRPRAAARVYRNRGVLPGFSKQGGIGTTPFLGNTRGMGGYSTNYSAPARTYVPSGYPAQNYVYPGNYVYPTQTYVVPTQRVVPAQSFVYPPMVGG